VSRPVQNQRLFVAVYPPVETVRLLLRAAAELTGLPPFEPTAPDLVHLTVQFLGDVAQKDLVRVHESITRATAGIPPMELTPRRLVALPQSHQAAGDRARTIACELDAPGTLVDLHRRLATRLAANKKKGHDDGYAPHLTLGRWSTPVPHPHLDHPVTIAPFAVEKIHLMRTVLKPGGTSHVRVDSFVLG
jgi:2'-5' RNA ligase